MRLTVHIGTTKTGSTSIQAFLRANRAALLDRGICVPESLGQQDHRNAALSCLEFGQSSDLMARQELRDAAALDAFRAETSSAFRNELAGARDRTAVREVVITSEHLQSRLTSIGNVKRFLSLFAQGFETVRIVLYVRPQFDQMVSLYSTTLRNGLVDTIDEHVERHMAAIYFAYFDLKGLLNRWGQVFGEENLMVRPYKALPPPDQGGVVADFCAILGISRDERGLTWPADANSAINAKGQDLLRRFNLARRAGQDPTEAVEAWIAQDKPDTPAATQRLEALRQIIAAPDLTEMARHARLVRWVETRCSGRGAEASLAQARAFQSRFDAGNAAVIAQYFPDHPEYLEPRWPAA